MELVSDTTLGEPGSLDNRLSLDPNDSRWKATVGAWRDGMDYTVNLRVRQVSPGEYEVIGMQGGEGAAENEQEEEVPMSQEAETAAPQVQEGFVNPAVQAMIGGRQRG